MHEILNIKYNQQQPNKCLRIIYYMNRIATWLLVCYHILSELYMNSASLYVV